MAKADTGEILIGVFDKPECKSSGQHKKRRKRETERRLRLITVGTWKNWPVACPCQLEQINNKTGEHETDLI